LTTSCGAQPDSGKQRLTLQQTISLPDVKGRIDHIDINVKDQVAYIAALGNNTLEVVDLKSGKVTGSIKGLDEPQGVAYISKHQEILIANGGTGECDFYNAITLKKTGSIKLTDDADDVRYDADADKISVMAAAVSPLLMAQIISRLVIFPCRLIRNLFSWMSKQENYG